LAAVVRQQQQQQQQQPALKVLKVSILMVVMVFGNIL
jgi:hypothetical protein